MVTFAIVIVILDNYNIYIICKKRKIKVNLFQFIANWMKGDALIIPHDYLLNKKIH